MSAEFFCDINVVVEEVKKHPQWLAIDSSDLDAAKARFEQLGFDDCTIQQVAKGKDLCKLPALRNRTIDTF